MAMPSRLPSTINLNQDFFAQRFESNDEYMAAVRSINNDFALPTKGSIEASMFTYFGLYEGSGKLRCILVIQETQSPPSLFQAHLPSSAKRDWSISGAVADFVDAVEGDYDIRSSKLGLSKDADGSWQFLTKLRDGLTFINLALDGAPLTSLPRDLRVAGELDISESLISEIRADVRADYLSARYTPITEIPVGFQPCQQIDLTGSQVIRLPDHLKIRGDLKLHKTPLTILPDNLYVGGSLYLDNPNITSLPDSLHVGETLDIFSTGITELPDDIQVGEAIIMNSNVTHLPTSIADDVTIILDDSDMSAREFRQMRLTSLPNSGPKL
jgi:hypothetical protein